ncbi:nitric oxide synthase oxygenase [Nonomuraea gerenzanensis]|uniref:Nitric oxide synthase oxygenase n=1 Tax=Nonomuraea gerenzanensis TaxID=93944 RepID=A0A1M4E449_9ACTN|nr:nitric oxide synthase oxygenase [Nonomuraea gerenzanensis]UBU15854.1 nitric oxide synthase oxygenase [Nonomuraea gerenzanensis]SBO93645.1 Nitric oxide synthase oxygenase [Nonomuraea gerenzanensis]
MRTWIRNLRPFDVLAAQAVIERTTDLREAERFIRLYHAENPAAGGLNARLRDIARDVARYGTYTHTYEELEFGARVAWRNSSRCIGRLYWRSLRVRDRRQVSTPEGVALECVAHLRAATGNGKIRPTVTVLPPDTPALRGPRLLNDQLVRYAGYRTADGVVGDPRNIALTKAAGALGWRGRGGRFDVLPLIIQPAFGEPLLCNVPGDAVLEVPLAHPDYPWFEELGLRWHAVPAISDMCLEIGGICYPCAPFNGWYMGTEIGARNLADRDRYDQLPVLARRLGLDTSTERSLWRDHALVELNVAVLYSFERAGVTMTDHHTESRRFLTHLAKEEGAGRVCPADWSWIVPPLSGSTTPVFHRYYDSSVLTPAFVHHR